MSKFISGGYSVGVPPLPIPNREVKPDIADGTAYSGRVGSRLFFREVLQLRRTSFFALKIINSIVYSWSTTMGSSNSYADNAYFNVGNLC